MASLLGQVTLRLDNHDEYEAYLEVIDDQEGLTVIDQDPEENTITAEINLEV